MCGRCVFPNPVTYTNFRLILRSSPFLFSNVGNYGLKETLNPS